MEIERERASVWIRVHACACRCAGVSVFVCCIGTHSRQPEKERMQTASKVEFLAAEELAGSLIRGITRVCICCHESGLLHDYRAYFA